MTDHSIKPDAREAVRFALLDMEQGYRMRCNYCDGKIVVCDAASPSTNCLAPNARKALAFLAQLPEPPK